MQSVPNTSLCPYVQTHLYIISILSQLLASAKMTVITLQVEERKFVLIFTIYNDSGQFSTAVMCCMSRSSRYFQHKPKLHDIVRLQCYHFFFKFRPSFFVYLPRGLEHCSCIGKHFRLLPWHCACMAYTGPSTSFTKVVNTCTYTYTALHVVRRGGNKIVCIRTIVMARLIHQPMQGGIH